MDEPHSIEVQGSRAQPQQGLLARVIGAAAEMELTAKFALICVFFAWFFLDTLAVSVGSVKHGVRFFDAAAIIVDPTRMFFTIDTTFGVLMFVVLCLACLLAPLGPHLWRSRAAWLGYYAPLALMLVCGLLLYSKTSGEILATPADVNGLKGSVMSFANKLLQRGSDLVSQHIAVGAGGYIAMFGSLVLAYLAARRLLRQR